jgi:hypothetical protein
VSGATEMDDSELRLFAVDCLGSHNPPEQILSDGDRNPYGRCMHCHFTRHPCDTYDLAAGVLRLLDEKEAKA